MHNLSPMTSSLDRPPPPARTSASLPSRVTFEGAQTWRESIAAFTFIALAVVVFFSTICVACYVYRDKAVYEELVDYLDKTVSISKINYNVFLGPYKLSEREYESLGHQRTYKTILWCYLAGELGCYIFLAVAILLYFTTDVGSGTMHVIFWLIVLLGTLYCVVEAHLFVFSLFPYSSMLPNTTELLLNHAIPHNPGGLLQMEQRLGCTFDHNLYAANKRRANPRNTCDPYLEDSFMPRPLLIVLLVLRLIPIVIGVLLLARRTPFSESIAQFVEKARPNQKKQRLYVKKQTTAMTPHQAEKKSTTFGVSNAPRYNNAAFFAHSGAVGLNSSRSSEISRIDHHDNMFKSGLTHHASGSLQSDV